MDTAAENGMKRQKHFAIKKEEIIPHIKVTVFKDPQITVPVLLNILEDFLGKLFAEEENRSGCGTKAAGYNQVYNAREVIRDKYCGKLDNVDYLILPKLKQMFEKLDQDNTFEILKDANEHR
jgi:hypothetical protein